MPNTVASPRPEELAVAEYERHEVVEVVRDAPREAADGFFHLLRLAELVLELLVTRLGDFLGRDVLNGTVELSDLAGARAYRASHDAQPEPLLRAGECLDFDVERLPLRASCD